MTPQQWLQVNAVRPDFACTSDQHSADLDYIHRRTKDTDIYFVRNKSMNHVNADCVFRVLDRTPQFWDPFDGTIKPAFVCRSLDGGTRVRLDLPPGGSIFVVFQEKSLSTSISCSVARIQNTDLSVPVADVLDVDEKTAMIKFWQNGHYTLTSSEGSRKDINIDSIPSPMTIDGEWVVDFDPQWGAPAQVRLAELMSWTEHENEGVKYYSGAGVYTKSINVPAEWLHSGRSVYLDLGEVRELAEVYINGKPAGILWKPPFRTEITSLLKAGENKLTIEVMNLWINRLAGDQYLPPEKRYTRTNIRVFDGYMAKPGTTWPPKPAGLLGPVRLLPADDINIDLPQ